MEGKKKETIRRLNGRKEKRNSLSDMAEWKEGRKKQSVTVSEMAEWKEGKKKPSARDG